MVIEKLFARYSFFLVILAIFLYFTPFNLLFAVCSLFAAFLLSIIGNKSFLELSVFLRIVFLVFFLIANALLPNFFISSSINYDTFLHVVVILSLCCFTCISIRDDDVTLLVNIFIFLTLFLLLLGTLYPSLRNVIFFSEYSGVLRYKGLFKEPSYNGLFSAFVLHLRMYHFNKSSKVNRLQLIFLVAICLTSLSGSGLAMLAVVFFIWFKKFRFGKFFYILSSVFCVFIFVQFFDIFEFMIGRFTRIISGNADESVIIRFFAPAYIVDYFFMNYPFWGVGLSNVGSFIHEHYDNFSFLAKYNDPSNTNVDNGLVYWFAGTGLLGCVVLILVVFFKKSLSLKDKIFFFTFLFFTGSIVNPLFIYPMLGAWRVEKSEL